MDRWEESEEAREIYNHLMGFLEKDGRPYSVIAIVPQSVRLAWKRGLWAGDEPPTEASLVAAFSRLAWVGPVSRDQEASMWYL